MFLGHFAAGFAAKRLAPRTNLGWLIGGALLIDLLWPFFLMVGLETVRVAPGDTAFTPLRFVSYPYTHSLPGCLWWAAAFAAIYMARRRNAIGTVTIFLCVVSHWVLDVVSHRADVPLGLRGPYLGLGLWNSVPATAMVEGALFAGGLVLYASSVRRVRFTAVLILASVLAAIYAASIFGPPPPDAQTVMYTALLLWIFPLWAALVDQGRVAR